ncbi:MAG: hypothetical protein AB6733_00100 [Clostridiaceae bacterium]
MIISGDNLKLYCYNHSYSGFENLREIEKGEYGYNLQPGQTIKELRYQGNPRVYCHCKIVKVDEISLIIEPNVEFAWTMGGKKLEVSPCAYLYERNKLSDILNGNIKRSTPHPSLNFGTGIWHKNNGNRIGSMYEENLKHFVKLGQATMF